MKETPEFELIDQNGKLHKLSDYKGSWLVIYFYPKDNTPGCTKEACSFRDSMASLKKNKISVIGISKDSNKSHVNFSKKYELNFPILSDESHKTIKSYGAWGKKKFMGREYEGTIRKTFIINPDGKIIKEYEKVKPVGHAEEVLSEIIKHKE